MALFNAIGYNPRTLVTASNETTVDLSPFSSEEKTKAQTPWKNGAENLPRRAPVLRSGRVRSIVVPGSVRGAFSFCFSDGDPTA